MIREASGGLGRALPALAGGQPVVYMMSGNLAKSRMLSPFLVCRRVVGSGDGNMCASRNCVVTMSAIGRPVASSCRDEHCAR